MDKYSENFVKTFMSGLVARNPGESEFHQAVGEVVGSVAPYLLANPHLIDLKIMERIAEPERVIMFRVPWMDDGGRVQVNRGFRVQRNSAIGYGARYFAQEMLARKGKSFEGQVVLSPRPAT